MKVGISCAGIAAGATGAFVRAAAEAAEAAGFASFWLPDHVLLFKAYDSSYAYGDFHKDSPVPDPHTPLVDPVIGMTWAAAATSRIEVGTSILILPQRNPVVLAKQLATLDAFSDGRVALGVGVGWSTEEYAAIGADWSRRGKTMDEYIAAMRALWREPVAEFAGETVRFSRACLNPKPARDIPIIVGGESEAAMKRIARAGDGWIPAKLPIDGAAEQIAHLHDLVRAEGRDPATIRIIAPLTEQTPMDDARRLHEAGVTEFYLGVWPPETSDTGPLRDRLARLGEAVVQPLAEW